MVKITIYYNHEKKNYFLKILDMVEKKFFNVIYCFNGCVSKHSSPHHAIFYFVINQSLVSGTPCLSLFVCILF